MSWTLLLFARLFKLLCQWGYFAIPHVIGCYGYEDLFWVQIFKLLVFAEFFTVFLPRPLLTWLTGSHRESFVQPSFVLRINLKNRAKKHRLHYGNQPSWDLLLIKTHYNTHLFTWRAFVLPHNFSRKILYGPTEHRTI